MHDCMCNFVKPHPSITVPALKINTSAMNSTRSSHSRRHRNKNARLLNAIVGVLFLVGFLLSLISFCSFLFKQLEVTNHTLYNNGTFGNCILYADWIAGSYPSVRLGSSGLCAFVIYGQLLVMVYTLVVFFVLFFKSIIGCAIMRCDLIVELLLNIVAFVFQFLTGIALTSGFKDTCEAVTDAPSSPSCSDATLPPEGEGIKFFGSVLTAVVFLWFSVFFLALIIIYYIIAVIMCVRHRFIKRSDDSTLMVEQDNTEENQMYALESESELRGESVH